LAGTLLVFAYLVIPAVMALLLTQRLGRAYALAMRSAALAAVAGLMASVRFDLPTGPAIVAALFLLLCLSLPVNLLRRE